MDRAAYCWANGIRWGGPFGEDGFPFTMMECLERPSEWDDQEKRFDTRERSNCKLRIRPESQHDHAGVIIDVIGTYGKSVFKESRILQEFDFPCCQVGFTELHGTRKWILHSNHITIHSFFTNKEAKHSTSRFKQRWEKYLERGYGNPLVQCDCMKEIMSGSKRLKMEDQD
jgi:hypothetical protein